MGLKSNNDNDNGLPITELASELEEGTNTRGVPHGSNEVPTNNARRNNEIPRFEPADEQEREDDTSKGYEYHQSDIV